MIRPILTEAGCLERQRRLCRALEQANWDYFLSGNPRTVYSLTAALIPLEQPALFLLRADGHSVLISAHTGPAFVDELAPAAVYSPVKPIVSPMLDAARILQAHLPQGRYRIGVELAYTPASALTALAPTAVVEDAGNTVLSLRRSKDEDELDEIRRSLGLNAIAYDAARKTIRPGLTELELHAAMSLAVAHELGTAIPIAGDFSCGLRSLKEGGAPTARAIQRNDLCVLDLFIAPAYYFGDTCRTFCAGTPDSNQLEAWRLVRDTLMRTGEPLRPGLLARDMYQSVLSSLNAHPLTQGTFWHHAGHGIGCQGHEAPRLIPESPDVIQEGDVIAVEPAIYVESLRGGLRLENSYHVQAAGAANLFDYPLEMDLF